MDEGAPTISEQIEIANAFINVLPRIKCKNARRAIREEARSFLDAARKWAGEHKRYLDFLDDIEVLTGILDEKED